MAEAFFKVADDAFALEGPAFDRHGNLLFVDIYHGRVLSRSPEQGLSKIMQARRDRTVIPRFANEPELQSRIAK